MINKELKHLNRRELVDIIYQLKKNEQEMQEELESLKKELEDKRIRISVNEGTETSFMCLSAIFYTLA